MTCRSILPYWVYLGLLSILAVLAVGCAMQEPQALTDIYPARDALAASKTVRVADRFPDEFAELEKRYLAPR